MVLLKVNDNYNMMMEYLLSKLLPMMVYPLGLSVIFAFIAIFLSRIRRFRSALLASLFSVSILWVCSTQVFSDFIRGSLELIFPPVLLNDLPMADAIVILGGGTGSISSAGVVNLQSATDRVFHGLRLYKAGKAPVIILTGGGIPGDVPEADVMADLLEEFGIPRKDMLLDTESLNSRQNALYTQRIMKTHDFHRVLLVTSAGHMKRALAVFQTLGIDAIPAATDYEVKLSNPTVLDWLPSAHALSGSTYALKEYIALVVYRLRGWIRV